MTDLQTLVKQTSNPSILKMQQRLHTEVVELGKKALQWREGCEALQLALETEREAANLYAKQVAHWIEKYDLLRSVNQELVGALVECERYGGGHTNCEQSYLPPTVRDKVRTTIAKANGQGDNPLETMAEQPAQQESALDMCEHRCPQVTWHRGPSFVCQKAGHGVGQNSYCEKCECPQAIEAKLRSKNEDRN